MYLRQITLTGGIPFSLSLPKAPAALNADTMTDEDVYKRQVVRMKKIQNFFSTILQKLWKSSITIV